MVPAVMVSDDCTFDMDVNGIMIPGAANPISGSDILGEIQLLGSLRTTDLYCGIANGTANVSGAPGYQNRHYPLQDSQSLRAAIRASRQGGSSGRNARQIRVDHVRHKLRKRDLRLPA